MDLRVGYRPGPMHADSLTMPLVTENWLPPIGEGFKKVLEYSELAEAVNLAAEAQIAKGTTDPYDTHPLCGSGSRRLRS
jgi:hypothetical protein